MSGQQPSFFLNNEHEPRVQQLQLHHLIVDRGSKYSVTAIRITSQEELKHALKELLRDKRYRKATHNSYGARYVENGAVIEIKADDGETGAGMTILRPMRSANIIQCVIVVTRWFGGIKLQGDRFKHVQDATQAVINDILS